MSLNIPQHPEFTSGGLDEYGFHKVERQVKSIIKNILDLFFSKKAHLYRTAIPEIIETANGTTDESIKVFIERNFPFYERKLPLIAITCKRKKEKKPFIGTDDFLYESLITTSTGELSLTNMYSNMFDVSVGLVLATISPESRMQLQELVSLCFSHYFRWPFMYKGGDGSYFNMIPSQTPIDISGENEVTDKSKTTLLYTSVVNLTSAVEYIFPEVVDNFDLSIITGIQYLDNEPSTEDEDSEIIIRNF